LNTRLIDTDSIFTVCCKSKPDNNTDAIKEVVRINYNKYFELCVKIKNAANDVIKKNLNNETIYNNSNTSEVLAEVADAEICAVFLKTIDAVNVMINKKLDKKYYTDIENVNKSLAIDYKNILKKYIKYEPCFINNFNLIPQIIQNNQ